jgi:hypothetical protein
MAATNVYEYLLTLKIGTKLIKGLETAGLKIKPNFEQILLKADAGVPVDDFVDFDADMPFGGKTIEMDSAESTTHEDFETIRVAASTGATVTFVYGRTATGEKQVTGSAKITDYSEDSASAKKLASFSGNLKAIKGTVTFGVQA